MDNIEKIIRLANDVFYHDKEPQDYINNWKYLFDGITAHNLQLSQKMSYIPGIKGWKTEDIYTTDNFSLQLFMLPRGETMPMHDHPSMWILMKALWGKLRIHGYDWATEYPWSGLARLVYDLELDGSKETLVISPNYGNIHQIYAVEDCAFVDFIFPPYSEEEGRRCHYYRVASEKILEGEKFFKLAFVG